MRQKMGAMLCTAILVLCLGGTALAAEQEKAPQMEKAETTVELPNVPKQQKVFPAEVNTYEENGAIHLEKVYYLTGADDPAAIPVKNFEREGQEYQFLDLLKNDQSETDTKEHIEVLTMQSDTKDMEKILQKLEPTMDVTTEDGYTGTLALDHTTIRVEAAGYKNSTRNISTTRSYPNLSDADVALVPKTVQENGRTLTLADVQWQEAATDNVDGYDLAMRYHATATYTGIATSKYATGYVVTADYKGDITKTSNDTVVYTAVFSCAEPSEKEEEPASAHTLLYLLLILAGAGGLGAAGYFGRKSYLHYQNKKRGYE